MLTGITLVIFSRQNAGGAGAYLTDRKKIKYTQAVD
jgi:hypothetical protein